MTMMKTIELLKVTQKTRRNFKVLKDQGSARTSTRGEQLSLAKRTSIHHGLFAIIARASRARQIFWLVAAVAGLASHHSCNACHACSRAHLLFDK